MEIKKIRNIVTVIWGMLFIFNLNSCLHAPTFFGCACTGFLLGGIFIMLLTNPILKIQEKFIELLMKYNKFYSDKIIEITNYYSKKNNKKKK